MSVALCFSSIALAIVTVDGRNHSKERYTILYIVIIIIYVHSLFDSVSFWSTLHFQISTQNSLKHTYMKRTINPSDKHWHWPKCIVVIYIYIAGVVQKPGATSPSCASAWHWMMYASITLGSRSWPFSAGVMRRGMWTSCDKQRQTISCFQFNHLLCINIFLCIFLVLSLDCIS